MPFTSVQKIRFDDVDGAGIVYYPRFFHLCHAAFEDFFDTAAPFSYPDLINKQRLGFPTVHIDADFKAPLMYGDTVVVTLEVIEIGRSSVKTRYEVRRKRDGATACVAIVTTVLISLDTQKSQPLSGEMRRVFDAYLTR